MPKPNRPKKNTKSKVEHTKQADQPFHLADPTGNVRVDPEEVARLAYSYWEARVRVSPEEDWFKAEDELRQRGKLLKQS